MIGVKSLVILNLKISVLISVLDENLICIFKKLNMLYCCQKIYNFCCCIYPTSFEDNTRTRSNQEQHANIDYERLNVEIDHMASEVVQNYTKSKLFNPTICTAVDKQIIEVSMRHSIGLLISATLPYTLPKYTICSTKST